MKRIVCCIVITGIIFASGIFSLIYTTNTLEDISENLEQVKEEFKIGNNEAAKAAAKRASARWSSFRETHFLTTDNDHILEITMTAKRIESLLEKEDEEALTECDVMVELIRVYNSEQMPNFMNIL